MSKNRESWKFQDGPFLRKEEIRIQKEIKGVFTTNYYSLIDKDKNIVRFMIECPFVVWVCTSMYVCPKMLVSISNYFLKDLILENFNINLNVRFYRYK